MNNQQFRRLLVDNPRQQNDSASKSPAAGAPQAVLGARKHSSIPMTPRQVARGPIQSDFARQLAERNGRANPPKKDRASAPKGTKLAAGYTDRTKHRTDEGDSETAQRIRNLEETMKLGQIDRETFEHLVQELTGGDVGTTHLVKGLDRKLLERVRRGEDVLGAQASPEEEPEDALEVENAFDELAGEHIGPKSRETREKKGTKIASPLPVAGVKRSRDNILKELKRQREEAAKLAAAEHDKKYPALGPGFRKVNTKGETSRIETDGTGRQILIVTGPDGKEKRKIRRQETEEQPPPELRHDLDDATKPINMHCIPAPKKQDSEDDDIFAGVGSNYNPLADLGNDDSSDADESKPEKAAPGPPAVQPRESDKKIPSEVEEDAAEKPAASAMRDYFRAAKSRSVSDRPSLLSSADATVRAALAKVRNLDESSILLKNLSTNDSDTPHSKEAQLKKRAAELAVSDRDMEDLDLGFGASRFDDADEMEREGERVKFSEWKGLGANDNDEDVADETRGGIKRKRGSKKKKRSDKNKANDVLQVMERQKKEKTLS